MEVSCWCRVLLCLDSWSSATEPGWYLLWKIACGESGSVVVKAAIVWKTDLLWMFEDRTVKDILINAYFIDVLQTKHWLKKNTKKLNILYCTYCHDRFVKYDAAFFFIKFLYKVNVLACISLVLVIWNSSSGPFCFNLPGLTVVVNSRNSSVVISQFYKNNGSLLFKKNTKEKPC